MMFGVATAAGSAVLLIGILALYRAEDKRGSRIFLSGFRESLDAAVLGVQGVLVRLFGQTRVGVVRTSFHYLVHRALARVIGGLTRCQSYLSHLQRRNRHVATMVREDGHRTHLDEIASHKEEFALSDEEKRLRRSH